MGGGLLFPILPSRRSVVGNGLAAFVMMTTVPPAILHLPQPVLVHIGWPLEIMT